MPNFFVEITVDDVAALPFSAPGMFAPASRLRPARGSCRTGDIGSSAMVVASSLPLSGTSGSGAGAYSSSVCRADHDPSRQHASPRLKSISASAKKSPPDPYHRLRRHRPSGQHLDLHTHCDHQCATYSNLDIGIRFLESECRVEYQNQYTEPGTAEYEKYDPLGWITCRQIVIE
jgi:hypothetical protein